MNLGIAVNRVLICYDAIKNKICNNKICNNCERNVIIVFQQVFGDAVVFSDTLKYYKNIFRREDGYKIIFLVRTPLKKFMIDVLPTENDVEYVSIDFKRFVEDYKYYKSVIKQYSGNTDIIIVPGTSLSAEIFSTACRANRKIGLVRPFAVTSPFYAKLFYNSAYTETVVPEKDTMMLQRHRMLLNYLGCKEYKAKLPSLLPQKKVIEEEKYCVMCPGSSKKEKCWQTEKFAQIADFIIGNYDMNIHLCGGADEKEYEKSILSQVKYPERVTSHIGKTTFSEWSSIVQHSEIVIGNDSATMHLAAASKRKAVCIAGVYDKYQFFPYKVDVLEEGERLPVTVIKEFDCEWCRTIGYYAGYGNKKCKDRIDADECALCIDAISVDDVKKQVEKLMNDED